MPTTVDDAPVVGVDLDADAILPGYYVEPATGAWVTLEWPADPATLPPSLGPAIVHWCETSLVHHINVTATGESEPWRFTTAQRRFIWMWYAVGPDGRWVFRSGVKRGAKGTGKDPLAAALALAELAGPTYFADWSARHPITGAPFPRGIAHRMALVQIAANSEGQAADVLAVANAIVSRDTAAAIGYDPGILVSRTSNNARLELLTASVKSSEGDPATAIFLNESHHMNHTSGGQRLAGVARRNAAKSPGGRARLLELTNAHMPGEGSVAEESFSAWQSQVSGATRRRDILYDSREAPPHLRLHVESELAAGLAAAYADAPWVDLDRIAGEAMDPRIPVSDSIRFYFNALPTNNMAWVDPRRWDRLGHPDMGVHAGEPIAMFLDCSKSSDATVLVGCRISDGHVMALGGWQRPHGDRGTGWLAPREEVDAVVRLAFDTWDVQWFGVDPSPARDDADESSYWGELIDQWHRDYRTRVAVWATPGNATNGSAVLFDMRLSAPGARQRLEAFTKMAERTAADIDEWDGTGDAPLTHDGNPMLRVHVHNARRRANPWGVSLSKETRDSSKLVDYAVAMVGARLGRRIVLNGPTRKKRSGKVW